MDGYSLLIIPNVPRDVLNHKKYIFCIKKRVLACIKKQAWVKQFGVHKSAILKKCDFYFCTGLSQNKNYLPLKTEIIEKCASTLDVTQDSHGNIEAEIGITFYIQHNDAMTPFCNHFKNRIFP